MFELRLQLNLLEKPIAVEATNIPATNHAEVHHPTTYFIYSYLLWSMLTIYGCYIQFQFLPITALTYFHEIYQNDPPGNDLLSEYDPPEPISKFWKWLPSKMATWPPPPPALTTTLQVINDKPLNILQ